MDRNADKENGWLIFKKGRGWYRPNAQGYTMYHADAGRYSWDDAHKHSHPNGLHGPRDGMSIHHESDMSTEAPGAAAMTGDLTARGVPPTWPSLRDAIEKMVAYPAGDGWHVSREAADKAIAWIGWAEIHQSEPVPKLLPEEDEDLSLVWRTADGWAIHRTFPSDGEPSWLAMPSRNPAALSDHPTVKQMVAAERDAWREEPESSEAWCAGNQHVLDRLCVVVGADPAVVQWDGSDGSLNEETDALIWRILRHNDDDDGLSPRERALVAEAEARGMERAAGMMKKPGDMWRTCTTSGGPNHDGERWVHSADFDEIWRRVETILAQAAAIRKGETT